MESNNNPVPISTFYPVFGGPTMGQVGSGAADTDPVTPANASAKGEVAQAAAVGSMGNPLIWFVTFLVLLFALMFIAKRFGSEASEFASIKLSFYNLVVIAFAAMIGINLFKMVFNRFKVPGLTTFVNAV